jgi:hypothetical protein
MTEECDCIFCNFNCPECGSVDIEVEFTPRMRTMNFWKNRIELTCDDMDFFQIECDECERTFWEGDAQILSKEFQRLLNRTMFRIKRTGSIVVEDRGGAKTKRVPHLMRV